MENIKKKNTIEEQVNNGIKKDTEIASKEALKKEEHKDRIDKKIIGQLSFRESDFEEKERFTDRVPEPQKEALRLCAKIFNKECSHPWYTIGSIAFLINAKESKKQPNDIDIIFHEKDFSKIKEEFTKLGFENGIAETTNCPYIKGKIKVLVKNDQGVEKEQEIEVEAFGQKTDTPNGLINPGAVNTNYNIIENSISDDPLENFNILDRDGQIELYFKNLAEEIKYFNFESSLEDYKKHGEEEYYSQNKAEKFINRLVNLFELNNNNAREIIFKAGRISANDLEKRKLLKEFLNISNSFSQNIKLGDFDNFKNDTQEGQKIEKDVSEVLSNQDIQASIEKLKKTITSEINDLVLIYEKTKKDLKKTDNDQGLKENLYNKINEVIQEKEKIAKILLSDYKNIDIAENNYKNLAPYIFTIKFIQNYLHPFTEKMEEFKKELVKELVA